MFGKYSDEAIKRINARLGAGHRVKSYDLTNTDDLKQALLVSVAAYRDYRYYCNSLAGLEDNYDESIEYCDTAAWLDMETAPDKADALIVEGFAALSAAIDVFDRLTERAKRNCAKTVKAALTAPPAAQESVLGRVYAIKPAEMDAKIEELFELLGEVEYHQAMPDNLKAFLNLMEEQWA